MVCSVEGDESGKMVQFGVSSFVSGKCNKYSAYTNVALYNDWIREQAED